MERNETMIDKFPEVKPEDFLLPDIIINEDNEWNVRFENIKLNSIKH